MGKVLLEKIANVQQNITNYCKRISIKTKQIKYSCWRQWLLVNSKGVSTDLKGEDFLPLRR